MNIKKYPCVVLACVTLCTLFGCTADNGVPMYAVQGTVTLKGKPVEGAIVAFTPESGGLPASGTTDASGVYKLTTKVSGDGAAQGRYLISVAKYDSKLPAAAPAEATPAADPYDITNEYPTGYNEMAASEIAASISKNLLPKKYSMPQTSGLTADVQAEGTNSFDFDLK